MSGLPKPPGRLAPRRTFLLRVLRHGGAMVALLGAALAVGVVGYHVWGGLSWLDSLLNAAMILGGMGPVDPLTTTPIPFGAGGARKHTGALFDFFDHALVAFFVIFQNRDFDTIPDGSNIGGLRFFHQPTTQTTHIRRAVFSLDPEKATLFFHD